MAAEYLLSALEVKVVKNVTSFVTVPATYKLSPHSDISAVSHQLSLCPFIPIFSGGFTSAS